MALSPKAWLASLRTLDRLLTIEETHGKLIRKQADEIQELRDRLTRVEAHVQAREEIMIAGGEGGGGGRVRGGFAAYRRDCGERRKAQRPP
jgi:hypothetical protein